tara:strand:- start:1080 stop:1826 length:747 start_codon:yes stop_codon:yes gene_type:complete
MINETINCSQYGKIQIKSQDISFLFNKYKKIYLKTFKVSESKLLNMKKLKEYRGGIIIEVLKNNELLALYSLSNATNNFLELGDMIKAKFRFPRNTFANALKVGCDRAILELKKNGVFGYPNNLALALELIAGFKIYARYQRIISIIIFNLRIKLPIRVYEKKIYLNYKELFKNPFSLLKISLVPTAMKYRNIRIYKKNNTIDKKTKFFFGLIYEFVVSREIGDPFILLSNKEFPLEKIDFQYTDNSA